MAHEAAKWATTLDHFKDYNEAVFRAFFERGENIGEADVLVRLANELNLKGEGLRRALRRHEFEAQVLTDERDAAILGINAVPAFVANRRAALSGVQSVVALQTLIERVKLAS
jgi:predicted DsbA family dithiol-disulfide isomerase